MKNYLPNVDEMKKKQKQSKQKKKLTTNPSINKGRDRGSPMDQHVVISSPDADADTIY